MISPEMPNEIHYRCTQTSKTAGSVADYEKKVANYFCETVSARRLVNGRIRRTMHNTTAIFWPDFEQCDYWELAEGDYTIVCRPQRAPRPIWNRWLLLMRWDYSIPTARRNRIDDWLICRPSSRRSRRSLRERARLESTPSPTPSIPCRLR